MVAIIHFFYLLFVVFFYINYVFILSFYIMKNFEIVFVVAMKSEAETVISNMVNIKSEKIYNNEIFYWNLFGHEVVVIICGIWKVNAARATQYAIDILWAKKIINVWFAWWLNSDMVVWKTYQIKAAVEYDFDLAELNKTEIWVLNEFDDKYLKLQTIGGFEEKILGTWDRFNDSKPDYELLVNSIDADVRDMEWAAIVHTAIHAWVPVYMFKTISDVAGSGATTEQFLANIEICAKWLKESIEKIISSL